LANDELPKTTSKRPKANNVLFGKTPLYMNEKPGIVASQTAVSAKY
jgi:hypothetical protein